jgi:tellurite resistance protein TehA-like permease
MKREYLTLWFLCCMIAGQSASRAIEAAFVTNQYSLSAQSMTIAALLIWIAYRVRMAGLLA